jgi:alkylated DNA repair dioxygenase AlkB
MARKIHTPPPEGFRYQSDVISNDEEQILLDHIRKLPLKEYEFQGFTARRRVIYFGRQYTSDAGKKPMGPIPEFLHSTRDAAAAFAGLAPADLAFVQIIEYSPGAAIGWHRDYGAFGDIMGVSLLAPCKFRLRRQVGSVWERYSLMAEPRSIYLLRGPSRTEWQHSIPAVDALRFSIIFRTLR